MEIKEIDTQNMAKCLTTTRIKKYSCVISIII